MRNKRDIITRNFFNMLRSGALNEYVAFEPMSPYKWRKLVSVGRDEHVMNVLSRAVKNAQFEQAFNMPQALREEVHTEGAKNEGQPIVPQLSNTMLNKRLKEIIAAERRSDYYSKESVELLGILVANCEAMLNTGMSTRLIIRLANFIKVHEKRIDYTKVTAWIERLQLQRVAQLVGSLLIENFGMEQAKLPFVNRVDPKAQSLMYDKIICRKQSATKGVTYFAYAPIENTSIILDRLKNRLDTLEE